MIADWWRCALYEIDESGLELHQGILWRVLLDAVPNLRQELRRA
jgi:hypothetical protein